MRDGVACLLRGVAPGLAGVLVCLASPPPLVAAELPPERAPPSAVALFDRSCGRCHAGGGNSVPFYGSADLSQRALESARLDSIDAIVPLLFDGKGAMPPFNEGPGSLSEAEMRAVASYVLERASERWR